MVIKGELTQKEPSTRHRGNYVQLDAWENGRGLVRRRGEGEKLGLEGQTNAPQKC